ncbi:hypothetical protein ABC977_09625 [Thioalkalicoccus limnaeus]|uniref:Uncharacterized protein n=1 Tax=Thioalkalicoccus limnaeus TaxID=120681 RepID=A0ABV4BFC6_9GAMM
MQIEPIEVIHSPLTRLAGMPVQPAFDCPQPVRTGWLAEPRQNAGQPRADDRFVCEEG